MTGRKWEGRAAPHRGGQDAACAPVVGTSALDAGDGCREGGSRVGPPKDGRLRRAAHHAAHPQAGRDCA